MNELSKMTFDEMLSIATMEIMQELLAGRFKSGVSRMLNFAIRWKEAQE